MYKTLSFGEILWDIFPDYKKPGGSPANLAYHLHRLGHESTLVSQVGNDIIGKELVTFLRNKGLPVQFIQKNVKFDTGKVTVLFNQGEPSYEIHEPSAWDFIRVTERLEEKASEVDAVCFASLSQRHEKSRETLHSILAHSKPDCLKVFDLNLRPPYTDRSIISKSIEIADVVKFNEDELKMVSDWFDAPDLPAHLLENHPNKIILLTLGADGSKVFKKSGTFTQKAHPISEKGDFVGVGDAFLACFTHLTLHQEPDETILMKANKYAAYVASQKGGMPQIPGELIEDINSPISIKE